MAITKQKTTLTVVKKPHREASILKFQVTPAFTGNEDEDLLCGGCGTVLFDGVSAETISRRYAAPVQLLATCVCGAHNRLPAQVGH